MLPGKPSISELSNATNKSWKFVNNNQIVAGLVVIGIGEVLVYYVGNFMGKTHREEEIDELQQKLEKIKKQLSESKSELQETACFNRQLLTRQAESNFLSTVKNHELQLCWRRSDAVQLDFESSYCFWRSNKNTTREESMGVNIAREMVREIVTSDSEVKTFPVNPSQ